MLAAECALAGGGFQQRLPVLTRSSLTLPAMFGVWVLVRNRQMAMLVPEKARVQAGPVFDSRQHEARTLKEHFSVSRTSGPGTKGCLIEMLAGSWVLIRTDPSRVESSRLESIDEVGGQVSRVLPFPVLPSPVGTGLVGETRRGEVRFGHVCLHTVHGWYRHCVPVRQEIACTSPSTRGR